MDEDFTTDKPQQYNQELEEAIIRLNFSEVNEFSVTVHPFWDEIKKWTPREDLGRPRHKNSHGHYVIPYVITEVNDEDQFDEMINHLKEMPEWAVDLEHCDFSSYLGITCTIQISTEEKNFLIDPFDLNRKIKQDLKPLMESGHHVKVFHGSHNDLKWLQRDFNIFAWPVIDTQVIYRSIGKIKGYEDWRNNIALATLVNRCIPSAELTKKYTCANFKRRPLREELKQYAIEDTKFLLPVLCELRKDLERAPDISFAYIVKDSVEYISKKAIYERPEYYSAGECIFEMQLQNVPILIFQKLHTWREDKAKVLDEIPDAIIDIGSLAILSTFKDKLQKLSNIKNQRYLSPGFSETDIQKIKEIITTCEYKRLTLEEALCPCSVCGEYSHPVSFWPGRKQNCTSQGTLVVQDWQDDRSDLVYEATMMSESPEKISTRGAASISDDQKLCRSRMVKASSKFPYSHCSQIELYSFTVKELRLFIDEIKLCISKTELLFKCAICNQPVNQAVVINCLCDELPICCKYCWELLELRCLRCGNRSVDAAIQFEPIDAILDECKLFMKKIKTSNTRKLFNAMINFLRNTELELMCNYCFGSLENTMVVKVAESKDDTELLKSSQCCRGCDTLYMECYGRVQKSVPCSLFDSVTLLFNSTLTNIVSHCQENKTPHFKSTNEFYGKLSIFRKQGREQLSKELKLQKKLEAVSLNESKYFNSLVFGIAVAICLLAIYKMKDSFEI